MSKVDDSLKFYDVDDIGLCITSCEFTDEKVGSIGCLGCPGYLARNLEKRYVRCSKYGKKGRNYHKLQRPE